MSLTSQQHIFELSQRLRALEAQRRDLTLDIPTSAYDYSGPWAGRIASATSITIGGINVAYDFGYFGSVRFHQTAAITVTDIEEDSDAWQAIVYLDIRLSNAPLSMEGSATVEIVGGYLALASNGRGLPNNRYNGESITEVVDAQDAAHRYRVIIGEATVTDGQIGSWQQHHYGPIRFPRVPQYITYNDSTHIITFVVGGSGTTLAIPVSTASTITYNGTVLALAGAGYTVGYIKTDSTGELVSLQQHALAEYPDIF